MSVAVPNIFSFKEVLVELAKQRDNTQNKPARCEYRKEKYFIQYLQEYMSAYDCAYMKGRQSEERGRE